MGECEYTLDHSDKGRITMNRQGLQELRDFREADLRDNQQAHDSIRRDNTEKIKDVYNAIKDTNREISQMKNAKIAQLITQSGTFIGIIVLLLMSILNKG